jgi:uncharacterized membrane protein (DUF485 family)
MTQNYANHVHRPTMTIVGYLFLLIALAAFVLRWLEIGGRSTIAIGLAAVVMSLATLLAISRVYITRLQDRIIRLEMRMRAAALLSPDQLRMLERLTPTGKCRHSSNAPRARTSSPMTSSARSESGFRIWIERNAPSKRRTREALGSHRRSHRA